jgi:transcriptional enhancer factor
MDNINVDTNSSNNNGIVDEAEGIWSADIEQSFLEALAIYPPCGRRKIILTEEGKMYGRNELVARYIKIRTGKTRTRKQVSSHLQVLAKRRSKEIQSLRNDKAAQQVILERLKQYTSAEIVSMNHEQIQSDDESCSDDNEEPKKKKITTPIKNLLPPVVPMDEHSMKINQPLKEDFILSPQTTIIKKNTTKTVSPVVYNHGKGRSRCSSNASSSSPLSSGSTASQNLMITNSTVSPFAIIGDENFRLYDLNTFAEIKRAIVPTHPSLIYPSTEAHFIHQHDLLRLHANDIQMKNIHTFETISIDQIFDKFPRYDGLKDLFEHNSDGPFFLIKFWADVSISSMANTMNIRDESFFTSYTYASCSNRPIHVATRLCSFGKQVLEKVETSEHPQRDQFDQFIYRFDRSPLCDYMVQFIQKLRSLPNTYMMNSVLENFTVLQVIKCLDNPERLLLCLAFVFEIATFDAGGPQYQVYKLVSN